MRSDHEDKLTQNHTVSLSSETEAKTAKAPFHNTKWEGMGLTLK